MITDIGYLVPDIYERVRSPFESRLSLESTLWIVRGVSNLLLLNTRKEPGEIVEAGKSFGVKGRNAFGGEAIAALPVEIWVDCSEKMVVNSVNKAFMMAAR